MMDLIRVISKINQIVFIRWLSILFIICIEDKPVFLTPLLLFSLSLSPTPTRQYVRGSDPVIKLLDDNGNIAEELSILKWNTDSVEDFLSEKLDRI